MSIRRHLFATALLLGAAGPLWAGADYPPPPPDADMPDGPPPRGPGRHPMPPLMHELHQLNLSDDQRQQIRNLFESKRETMRAQMEALRSARDSFDSAEPGSAAFAKAQSGLEQLETAAAQQRIRNEAELRTKIYALLTDDQKTTLKTLIAQRLADGRRGPPPGAEGPGPLR